MPAPERTWRNNFYARYRCRDCLNEFWIVRRKTYAAGVTLLVAIVLAVIAVFVMDRVFDPLESDDRSVRQRQPR